MVLAQAVPLSSPECGRDQYWVRVSSYFISMTLPFADGLNSQTTVRLFGDDTMTYLTVKSKEDAEEFQKDLDRLVGWKKTWQMEFHPDKCEVTIITRKKNPVKYPYTLRGHRLKHVDVVKYLGVKISYHTIFGETIILIM